LPDEAAYRTASLIADFATALTRDDILIILISGNCRIYAMGIAITTCVVNLEIYITNQGTVAVTFAIAYKTISPLNSVNLC